MRKLLGLGPARSHQHGAMANFYPGQPHAGRMFDRGRGDEVEGMGRAVSEDAGDKKGAWKGGGSEKHPPGSAPWCLLFKNLGELFRWDAASAADMCADAFPRVRPW